MPTIAETGIADFDYPIWYGVWVRAGTPQQVVDHLGKDIARALATPDLRDWLAKHGASPMSMTQLEFARFVKSESETAAHIFKNCCDQVSTSQLMKVLTTLGGRVREMSFRRMVDNLGVIAWCLEAKLGAWLFL